MKVKAAFLYNFTKFVDWPPAALAAAETFNVCVYADVRFREELRHILYNENVRGRPIQIEELKNGADLKACHLLYFDAEHLERSAKRLPSLRQTPVLTVGEGPVFIDQGGMIAFQLENNKVRFEISKRAADAAGLVISSKLLRVATRTVGTAP